MKTPFILIALAAVAHAEPVVILSHTVGSGGGRVTSANVSIVSEIGTLGGVVAESPSNVVVARQGFAGRLYDEAAFSIGGGAQFLAENGTLQATALVITVDNLFAPVPGSAVTWLFTNATGQAIVDAAGLITGQPVYETAALNLRGEYHGLSADVGVSVLDTLADNFGLYAGDTVPDAWQVLHFGTGDPFGVGGADPDGDGRTNAFEFLALTGPHDPASAFRFEITGLALPGVTVRLSSMEPGRNYVIQSAPAPGGPWTDGDTLTSETPQSNVTHGFNAPAGMNGFFRLEIRRP